MEKSLPPFFSENIKLSEKTYTQMGAVARYFAEPSNILDVQKSLFFCQEMSLPCALLGSGSNSIYSDHFFDGVVISFAKMNSWVWETEDILYVEAGVCNTEVSEICAMADRAGASWMYRMPGQIGGTIRMNARCYGGEISQLVKEVVALNAKGQLLTFSSSAIFQGYKKTFFMDNPHIVVGVRLLFPQKEKAEKLLEHMLECQADRHKKHHFDFPSCGSTFKNNYEIGKPSGRIFDELGLKGTRVGQVEVSQFHGNFIWNLGQAKALDMLKLCALMREQVQQKLQASVDLEVQPVGLFSQEIFEKCALSLTGPYYEKIGENQEKWVGLFYFPEKKNEEDILYPITIFSSPFFEYFAKPHAGKCHVFVRLIQLISLQEARQNPKAAFLKWDTFGQGDLNKLFPLSVPKEKPQELWHYSVSEIFLANNEKPNEYLEFEITPNENTIALSFANVRQQRNEKFEPFCETYSTLENQNFSFGINFTFQQLQTVIENSNRILMQCALSLGGQKYYLAPSWKVTEEEKPDFHQPFRYFPLVLF